MDVLHRHLESYQRETAELAASSSSTEASFYPAIQSLLKGLLRNGFRRSPDLQLA